MAHENLEGFRLCKRSDLQLNHVGPSANASHLPLDDIRGDGSKAFRFRPVPEMLKSEAACAAELGGLRHWGRIRRRQTRPRKDLYSVDLDCRDIAIEYLIVTGVGIIDIALVVGHHELDDKDLRSFGYS